MRLIKGEPYSIYKKIRHKSRNVNMLGHETARNQLKRITAELVGTTWLLFFALPFTVMAGRSNQIRQMRLC